MFDSLVIKSMQIKQQDVRDKEFYPSGKQKF